VSDQVNIIDFTPNEGGTITFTIYNETYQAVADLPLGLMQKLGNMRGLMKKAMTTNTDAHGDAVEGTTDLEPMLQLFDELLFDESAVRFRQGTTNKEKMIGIKVIMNLIPWLLEQYGVRPTQPSNPSSTGSEDDGIGTLSTDTVSHEELISSKFQGTPLSV
jgi:hypothetical protein